MELIMADESDRERHAVERQYDDHVVVYSDHVNVISTTHEVVVTVYQTTPRYPSDDPPVALSSKKATVILHPATRR